MDRESQVSAVEQQRAAVLATAYHESGHAVATRLYHRTLHFVTIVPAEGSLGRCVHDPGYGRGFQPDVGAITPKQYLTLLENLTILFAGVEAESGHTGWEDWDGAHGDYSKAIDLAEYIAVGGPDDNDRTFILQWRREVAKILVKTHQEQIASLAESLVQNKFIPGSLATKIIREPGYRFHWSDEVDDLDRASPRP